jgi:hypothetical protein
MAKVKGKELRKLAPGRKNNNKYRKAFSTGIGQFSNAN